jgi:group I intron endonuclease
MYVGYTEVPLEVRLQRHISKAKQSSSTSLFKAIRKYGENNFNIRMIETYSNKEKMIQGEIDWIAYFDTYKSPCGYNDTPGGEGGPTNLGKKFDDEHKLNMSQAAAGVPKLNKRKFSEEVELEICRLYVEEEMSTYALAKNFDCYRSVIQNILIRENISIRQSNYIGHFNGRNIFTLDQEKEICELYANESITRTALAKQFNCGKTTIRDILLRHNVKL